MSLPVPTVNDKTVNSKDALGIGILVISLLGGAWLMVAPFLVGYQSRGGHWPEGTRNEFFVGLGLVGLSLTALVVFAGNALAELSHRRVPAGIQAETDGAGYVE